MHIESLREKIEKVFLALGFRYKTIGDVQYLCNDNCCCKITYLKSFGAFVIESADSIQDAAKGLLEDGDLYYADTPEGELLRQLEEDVRRYYM